MHAPLRRFGLPLALLSAAALMPALLAPIPASADGAAASERSAQRESRELQRASRAEERTARAQEPVDEEVPTRCSGTIEATAARIVAGETVTLFGKLTCPTGMSAAKRQVTVYQGNPGAVASSLTTLGVATTEEDGSYKLAPLALDTNTTFRVRVGSRGAHTVVKVAPIVTLSGPSRTTKLSTLGGSRSSGGRSARVTFNGTVSPVDNGARVSLQVAYAATGEQWRTVGFASVGSDGTYSVAHSFRTAGQASVRVLVHPHKQNVVGASETLTYEVIQAQNAKLTIQFPAAGFTPVSPAS